MAGNKNRKRQYHRPPAQNVSVHRPVRLSQCMIVKNEEKNIEKALSWAKGRAFEQIVVDTGSTDRTVEIAESMGAKVYHFEWINDFAAAKNYAIEQAKGDWIAFLDADEYFSDKDTEILMKILEMIVNDAKMRRMKTAICCQIVQLDEQGKPFLALVQHRVFRNTPEIRYFGSIHESLKLVDPPFNAPEISIMHTGYTKTAYSDTGKAMRNIDMLEVELAKNPDSAVLKCYIADSLRIEGPYQDLARAESLYREALDSGQPILRDLKQGAYSFLIAKDFNNDEKKEEVFEMCRKVHEEFPDNPDFCFFYGRKLLINGEYKAAYEMFLECENILKGKSVAVAGFIIKNFIQLFFFMVLAAEELGDTREVIRCATLVLKEDKYQPLMLAPYIQAFKRPGFETSDEEIFSLLEKLYDFSNTKDKITVMKAAKNAGNMNIVGKVLPTFTSEELEWLTAEPDTQMLESMQKETDEKFANLIEYIRNHSGEEIFSHIKNAFLKLDKSYWYSICNYYNTYNFWGEIDPNNNNYESLHRRAEVFSEHCDDLVWLYEQLGDAFSKKALYAILSNWLDFDFQTLDEAKETQYAEYFDSRILDCGENEVFVDIGAYFGDSVLSFINYCGRYKRIICYEITPDVFDRLKKSLGEFPDIEFRFKGAGAQSEKMYVSNNVADCSANTLSGTGETEVEIVRIDDDIAEPVTFIKMDIEGSERDALRGCEQQIKKNKPKLAICTYHRYDDLYAIPRMIAEMNPSYKFYMRYHGGNIVPTEFHLIAV